MLLAALLIAVLVMVPITRAQDAAPETPVTIIELSGAASAPEAEISGMDWYGDWLLLLAENPNIYATEGNAGKFFALAKDDIMTYLLAKAYGQSPEPLTPVEVPVIGPDIVQTVEGFDGFEAVAFDGDTVYLTIEAEMPDGSMRGYLVAGTVEPDLSAINLDLENQLELLPQTEFGNISFESLFLAGDQIVALYELSGAGVNPQPQAQVTDASLGAPGGVALPNIEYRVTDATTLSAGGEFWVINYFFPGEDFLLPESDPLVEEYGQGLTHAQYPHVERLVALQYDADGITFVDRAPVQLELPGEDARNWEGIVRLDDVGFLLVTDQYPQTILGFVPVPGLE
jgi:hypothetical protein